MFRSGIIFTSCAPPNTGTPRPHRRRTRSRDVPFHRQRRGEKACCCLIPATILRAPNEFIVHGLGGGLAPGVAIDLEGRTLLRPMLDLITQSGACPTFLTDATAFEPKENSERLSGQ